MTYLLFAVLLVPGRPSDNPLSATSLLPVPIPTPNPAKNPLLVGVGDNDAPEPMGVTRVFAVVEGWASDKVVAAALALGGGGLRGVYPAELLGKRCLYYGVDRHK